MKLKAIIKLVFLGLILSGCIEDEQELVPMSIRGNNLTNSSEAEPTAFLNLAKFSLAEIISNSSDDIYKNFPEDKNKAWLIETIKDINVKNVSQKRYEKEISFDYDSESKKIYATNSFITTTRDSKPWSMDSKVKLDAVS